MEFFGKELFNLNPTNKVSSNQIDGAGDSTEISKLFHDKCRLLYSIVLTDAMNLHDNYIYDGVAPNKCV